MALAPKQLMGNPPPKSKGVSRIAGIGISVVIAGSATSIIDQICSTDESCRSMAVLVLGVSHRILGRRLT